MLGENARIALTIEAHRDVSLLRMSPRFLSICLWHTTVLRIALLHGTKPPFKLVVTLKANRWQDALRIFGNFEMPKDDLTSGSQLARPEQIERWHSTVSLTQSLQITRRRRQLTPWPVHSRMRHALHLPSMKRRRRAPPPRPESREKRVTYLRQVG